MEFCEILTCDKCGVQEDVSQFKREFSHSIYVEEVFSTIKNLEEDQELSPEIITLPLILKTIIAGENAFHWQYREVLNSCPECQTPFHI